MDPYFLFKSVTREDTNRQENYRVASLSLEIVVEHFPSCDKNLRKMNFINKAWKTLPKLMLDS